MSESPRKGALLDLLIMNREPVSGVMVGDTPGHSHHEFSILREIRKEISRAATLGIQRADYGLVRRLLDRVLWKAVLKGKGVQEGWTLFKREILKIQEQVVPICRKISWQQR